MALKVESVLLVEDDCPWDALPSWARSDVVRRLAVGPGAEDQMRANGLPFLVPDELVTPEEVEGVCVAAYEQLHATCRKLDELEVAPPRTFAHALPDLAKRVDAIVWRSVVLARLRVRFPESRLVAFRAPPFTPAGDEFVLGFRPHPWSAVLAEVEWSGTVHWLDRPVATARPAQTGMRLGARLRRNLQAWSAIQSCRAGMVGNLARIARRGRPALLVLKAPYDWMPVLKWAHATGIPILFDEPERYFGSGEPGGAAGSPATGALAAEWWKFCDSLPEWARSPLRRLWPDVERMVRQAPAAHQRINQVVVTMRREYRVAAVLNAIGPDLRMQTILGAYQRQGIPVLKWQHGSVWWNQRINQRMDECDLATADFHFTYGVGSTAAYASSGRNAACTLVAAGSPRLEALARRASGRTRGGAPVPRRMLYTPTNTYGDSWYCGFSPPFMDATYRRDQRDLLAGLGSLLAQNPDAQLTIKMPSHCSPRSLPPWVQPLHGAERCRLVFNEQAHSALLLEHDVAIIDCATTTMLEALATDIPLLVLMRAPRWPESEMNWLRRRARCFDEPAALLEELADHVAGRPYQADATDLAFIRRHGLGTDSSAPAKAVIADLLARARGPLTQVKGGESRQTL